jgi:hypothetical protein
MSLEIATISKLICKYLNGNASEEDQLRLDIWLAKDEIHQAYFKKFIENRKVVEYLLEYRELLDTQNTQLSVKKSIWETEKSSFVIEGFDTVLLTQVLTTIGYCFIVNLVNTENKVFVLAQAIRPDIHERVRRALLLLKDRIFSEINRG